MIPYSRCIFLTAFLAIAGRAASLPAGCAALSDGYLTARLATWQQWLGLENWKISLIMSPGRDLKPNTVGNIHWDADSKTAVIRVLEAGEYQLPCPSMLNDMEFTLVHELVHLELSSLPRSPASRSEEEHAVNRITDALLALERRSAAHNQTSR